MKFIYLLSLVAISANATISLPNNFETDFNQTITNAKGKVIEYHGHVKYKNEKQILIDEHNNEQRIESPLFKWDYTSPTQKEVCTDGVQLIVVDHDLEQVSRYLISEGINLSKILQVAQKLSNKDYKATYKEVEYLIRLDEVGHLKKIFYVDDLDNRVKILFDNMQYDLKSFDEKGLECTAPSDYDTIEG
jgi:outer membrane lipoprotein carrier protein